MKFENKGLVILLCVLVVVIVGLGVGIGVVSRQSNIKNNTEVSAIDEFVHTDRPIDADYVLDLIRTAESLDSVDDGIELYEAVIAANADSAIDLLDLRISYSKFLLNNGYVEGGLEQLDLVDQDRLDIMRKIELYIMYRNSYIYIGDEDMAAKYDAEIKEIMEENDIDENAEF